MASLLYLTVRAPATENSILFEKEMQKALDKIAKAYIPGCVQYWEQAVGNPWQQTLDQMEISMQKDSDGLVRKKIIWFEKTMIDMIDHYKNIQKKRKEMGLE